MPAPHDHHKFLCQEIVRRPLARRSRWASPPMLALGVAATLSALFVAAARLQGLPLTPFYYLAPLSAVYVLFACLLGRDKETPQLLRHLTLALRAALLRRGGTRLSRAAANRKT